MTHDVSFTASRFEHMPPAAVALAVLLHVAVGLALFWISPLRPIDQFEDAIEVSMEDPEAPPVVAEKAPEPVAQPATPSPPPAPTPTPTPQQPQTPPMRLGLPPPPAERSTNPRDVAGAEKPAPRATDMPTPDTVQEAGPKDEPKPEEPKQEEPKQEAAKEEPTPQPPEPPPQQQALAQPEPSPPPPPQQQALAKPEPPAPPPPSLEQALPPLEAPPPPVTERDIPKPVPAPPAPPPPKPQQAARPAPPPPAPRAAPPPTPAPRPATPPAPPQQLRPSPLAQQPRSSQGSQAAAPSSPTFRNPADNYGEKRAQEQYLWQVMRRIAQFPYVPKSTGVIREEGTVLTRVTISRQGQLLNVVMEKSSGLPSLDAGVMDTIRRASPYPPLPAEITGASHTFQLPVSFRYNEQR